MADIDPITREALRRAAHMQGKQNNTPPKPPETPHPKEHHRPPKPPEPKPEPPKNNFGLDALFKDKETSVILILIILLMGEKDCEHLLLALIYLLL
ncbi:MAG: hypothetical protein IJT79_03855 [Ruminococcus sp.]|nr:hypothetical protein [Ruminococcus sp.]